MANLEAVCSALGKTEAQLLKEWHDEELARIVGRSADDLASASGEIGRFFLEWVQRCGIVEPVCREYCARRAEILDEQSRIALAAALADLLLQIADIPSPVTIAALLVKSGCERLCHCEPIPPRL